MIELKYVVPLLTLLIGGLIGNRLALGRDKRKEFNELSGPLYENLENQKSSALKKRFPTTANEMNASSFIQIKRRLPKRRAKGLDEAISKYIEAKDSCGEWEKGKYALTKPELLIDAIENLQSYLPQK